MSQQYHQYNQPPPFKKFCQSPLLSENDDSSILGEGTECRKPVDQCNKDFFRSEATNSGVSSPESIAVSYTHLDVYKRQVQYMLLLCQLQNVAVH